MRKLTHDTLARLRASEQYTAAVARGRDGAEQQAIAAFIESFVSSFTDALDAIVEQASDPEVADGLKRALGERQRVVSSGGSRR